jgi:hypothetical protein
VQHHRADEESAEEDEEIEKKFDVSHAIFPFGNGRGISVV